MTAAFFDSFSDRFPVSVRRRRVDQPIPYADGVKNRMLTFARGAYLRGSEALYGHFYTAVECNVFHIL